MSFETILGSCFLERIPSFKYQNLPTLWGISFPLRFYSPRLNFSDYKLALVGNLGDLATFSSVLNNNRGKNLYRRRGNPLGNVMAFNYFQ